MTTILLPPRLVSALSELVRHLALAALAATIALPVGRVQQTIHALARASWTAAPARAPAWPSRLPPGSEATASKAGPG